MKHIKRSVTFLFIICLGSQFSCQSDSPKEPVSTEVQPEVVRYKNARLVQVDSIMLDVTGNFQVYDYQPESGLFLGGDVKFFISFRGKGAPKPNQLGFVIFDSEGNIVHRFNNTNGGPNGHGSAMQSAFFMGPDAIGVMGLLGLYKYDLNGKLIRRYKNINYQDIQMINQAKSGLSSNGSLLALQLAKSLEDPKAAYSDSLFQLVKPVKIYDLDQDNPAVPIHEFGYPDDSDRDLKLGDSATPLMTLNPVDSLLYTVFPELPEVVAYNLRSGEVEKQFALNPDNFKGVSVIKELAEGQRGMGWLNDGGRVARSKYYDMQQLGEYTLLRYNTAVPLNAVKLLMTSKGLRDDPNWPEIRRRHYKFYYQLIKDGKKVLPDFELPTLSPKEEHMEFITSALTRGKVLGGNGLDEVFVFIPNDGETERDYELIRVFKLELLEE